MEDEGRSDRGTWKVRMWDVESAIVRSGRRNGRTWKARPQDVAGATAREEGASVGKGKSVRDRGRRDRPGEDASVQGAGSIVIEAGGIV